MRRRTLLAASLAAALPTGLAAPQVPQAFPEIIHLPMGYRPEGIAMGNGSTLYVGSTVDGAIYRADVVTGRGEVFIPGRPDTHASGLEFDNYGRIWACGLYAFGFGVVVYDSRTGARLREYALGGDWVNDATTTSEGIYCSDSKRTVFFRLPNGPRLPENFEVIELPSGIGDLGAWNNGVVATPDGRIMTVQTNNGRLFLFNPRTRQASQIEAPLLPAGDGLLLMGRDLYVAQNAYNCVTKLRLNAAYTAATFVSDTHHPEFLFPTNMAAFGPYVYVANARSFIEEPTPTTPYSIVRIPR